MVSMIVSVGMRMSVAVRMRVRHLGINNVLCLVVMMMTPEQMEMVGLAGHPPK